MGSSKRTWKSSKSLRAAPDLTGDNFDAGAIRHSEKHVRLEGAGTKYVSVEGDNHEDPTTGTHGMTYPSRGSG